MDIITPKDSIEVTLDPSELNSQGVMLGKAGNYEEALRIFNLCLTLEPWDALVINNRADVYCHLGKLDKALDEEYYALTLNPKLAIGWCTLGEIQMEKGEYFSAKLNLEISKEMAEPESITYGYAVESLQKLSDLEQNRK